MTGTTAPPHHEVADAAARTVADLLGTTVDDVTARRSLFDLPGFDSVCIVGTLERLEDRFGVEVPAESIVPEAFETLDAVAELVGGGRPTPSGAGMTP